MVYPKAEWLRECRDAIGEPPRSFGLWDRLTYLRVPTPSWARGDVLKVFFNGRKRLLQDGYVTWGHFIQANYLLHKPGHHSAPGEVVYSSDPAREPAPALLEAAAGRLAELKGTTPSEPAAAAVARHLTAERTRAFGMPAPRQASAGCPLVVSTIYIYRPHLPEPRFLHKGVLPLFASTVEPRIVMPVPARYWPAELLSWWRNG